MYADEKIRPVVDRFRYEYKIARALLQVFVFLSIVARPAYSADLPFAVGEKLTYEVKWLWFDAGRVVLHIPDMVTDGDRPFMRFTLHTYTTHTIAKIFEMDDYFESYWDPVSRLPSKLVVKIRESYENKDKVMEFDHDMKEVVVTKDEKEPETMELDPLAQDFLSAGHFTRTWPLIPRQKIRFPVFEDDKNYNAVMKVIKKERLRIMGGMIDTVMIIPKIKFEGAFQSRGTLYVWMTDDEYKVPVKLKMKIVVGTMTATLVSAEGVNLNVIPLKKK